jgi:uncharacterized protein YciI/heme-degrading monooxygenase HmoA
MHYLLFYETTEDYVEKRAAFREQHLEMAWQSHERGELLLGGALANPIDFAVLLFAGESPEVAEAFAKGDPYVRNGLVKRWYVREWRTVVGQTASTPIKPTRANETESASSPPSRASDTALIARMWRARSILEKVGDYVQHATEHVFPALRAIEGHRGACLLRRTVDGAVDLVVITFWDSMEAVRRFAGANPEKAVVEPAARAALTQFCDTVEHFEVVDCKLGK